MGSSVSIADIYYQVQDRWQSVAGDAGWRLAIWVSPMENMAIIDRFLEIERSPAGSCDDVFFRFEAEYTGDNKSFTKKHWEEYRSWFTEELPEEYDILKALQKDGYMNCEYFPAPIPDAATPQSLWAEFLRFRTTIKGMEERNICIYFPPAMPDSPALTEWLRHVLKAGVPEGIRLVTIDYAEKRKITLPPDRKVIHLKAEFDLKAAINNEMDKECDTYDSTSFDSRYRRQVRKVMEITVKQDTGLLDNEVRTLLAIANESMEPSIRMATPLIASQAYYDIRKFDKSMSYVNEAIRISGEAMIDGDANGYPLWKVSMFQKAAILVFDKKREMAIDIYRRVAETAVQEQDAFYVMEGYRMCGFLLYELNKKEEAFEHFLLSLAGGSYLDMGVRRESTFLYSAYLSLKLGEDLRTNKEMLILKEQLQDWLGDDWQALVENNDMKSAEKRHKAGFF